MPVRKGGRRGREIINSFKERGLVSSYSSPKALEEDRKYYSAMNKPHAPAAWRIFQRKNILLLISGKVLEGM